METLDKKFTAAEIHDMKRKVVKITTLLDNSTSMDKEVLTDKEVLDKKMVAFKKVFVQAVNKFFQNLIDTGCEFEYDIVTFNTSINYLHKNKSSKEFIPIDEEYNASGCTAFYDSVGKVIKNQLKLDYEKYNIFNILLV